MFETLPASLTPRVSRSRPVLLAMVAHILVIGVAVGGTSSTPAATPTVHRDTIRFEMNEPEPPHQSDFRPDALLPCPPQVPDAPFDAPELPSPILEPQWCFRSRRPEPARSAPRWRDGFGADRLLAHGVQPCRSGRASRIGPGAPASLSGGAGTGRCERRGAGGVRGGKRWTGGSDSQYARCPALTPRFFLAALEALRDARFKPARRGGRSIAVLVQQTIRFRQQ